MRIELVAVDVNNDGDYVDKDEGFMLVFRASGTGAAASWCSQATASRSSRSEYVRVATASGVADAHCRRGLTEKSLEVVRLDRAAHLEAFHGPLGEAGAPFPAFQVRQQVATEQHLAGAGQILWGRLGRNYASPMMAAAVCKSPCCLCRRMHLRLLTPPARSSRPTAASSPQTR